MALIQYPFDFHLLSTNAVGFVPVYPWDLGDLGRCSKYSNYLPLSYFLIGIVNFPNGNFDNFDLRPPGVLLYRSNIIIKEINRALGPGLSIVKYGL